MALKQWLKISIHLSFAVHILTQKNYSQRGNSYPTQKEFDPRQYFSTQTGRGTSPRIVCFYQSWAQFYKPPFSYTSDQIPGYLCNDVVYAYITMDENDMTVKVVDHYADITQGGFSKVVALKQKYKGLKVLVSIGGWVGSGAKYSKMVASSRKRTIFVLSMMEFLERHNFEGLNFNWIHPAFESRGGEERDKANFVNLIRELSQQFRGRYKLTVTIPANPLLISNGYQLDALNHYVDEFYISAYDLRGHWFNQAATHSPFSGRINDTSEYKEMNINETLYYIVTNFHLGNKLVLGLPFYGLTYKLANPKENYIGAETIGEGLGGEYTHSSGMISFYEICKKLLQHKWPSMWDSIAIAPYTYDRDKWIGYENELSLKTKIRLVREYYNINKIMAWAVNYDDYFGFCGTGKYPLLTSIYESLS